MRLPFQVLILPYVIQGEELQVYAFQRTAGWYQFISGGGEGDETPSQSASRELREETGVAMHPCDIKRLPTISFVPSSVFREKYHVSWSSDRRYIPEFAYSVNFRDRSITLSNEHLRFLRMDAKHVEKLLRWPSNVRALHALRDTIAKKLMTKCEEIDGQTGAYQNDQSV